MLIHFLPPQIARFLFRPFESKESFLRQVEELRTQNPSRPIAFVLFGAGLLEFWALRTFLNGRYGGSFELRLGTRLPALSVENPKTLLRRMASAVWMTDRARSRIRLCADELKAGNPVVLNFENTDRKKPFEVPAAEKDLAYLEQSIPNLIIVPITFVWRRKRAAVRRDPTALISKVWSAILTPITVPWQFVAGDQYQPTLLRKLAILLRRYEHGVVRLTTPHTFGSGHTIRVMRRRIITSILQDRKVILGPVVLPPRLLGESIFRHPSFERLAQTVAQEESVPEEVVYKRAQKYLSEISANYSFFVIETFAWLLYWIFTRVFERISFKEEDFVELRLIAKEGPFLLVPSHKSYFDFLILSYLLFCNDISPPHIAAGINLSFWPFGAYARRAGAFFIRRSFRGNVIYSEVLRRYVAALLNNRHHVEFFIEGARSRSGKLAPPKYGLLKMIVDSQYEGLIQEKIRVVPVAINYERVTEARSHRRELEGGEKVQESILNLFRSTKVLLKSFGEVHVRLARPIRFEEALDLSAQAPAQDDAEARKSGVQKLAFEICHRINGVTPISGTGLVCAVLLAKPGATMATQELFSWLTRLHQDLKRLNVILSPLLESGFETGIKRALRSLTEDHILEECELPSGVPGIRIPEKQRVAGLYYKNSVIHALLVPAVKGLGRSPEQLLQIRGFLQFEFFFSEKDLFLQNIKSLPNELMTEFHAALLDDVLETISLGLRALIAVPDFLGDEKEWRVRLMRYGKASLLDSSLRRLESVNTQGFSAFVEIAKNRKWLIPSSKKGHLRVGEPTHILEALNQIQELRMQVKPWDEIRALYLDQTSGSEIPT